MLSVPRFLLRVFLGFDRELFGLIGCWFGWRYSVWFADLTTVCPSSPGDGAIPAVAPSPKTISTEIVGMPMLGSGGGTCANAIKRLECSAADHTKELILRVRSEPIRLGGTGRSASGVRITANPLADPLASGALKGQGPRGAT
jgi:hypothetical protein